MANHRENEEAMLTSDIDLSFDISDSDFLAISDGQEDFQAISSTFLDDSSVEVRDAVTDHSQCDDKNQTPEVDTLFRSPDRGNEQDSGITVDGVEDPLHTAARSTALPAPTVDVGTQACPAPASPTASSPSSSFANKIMAKMEELTQNLLVVTSRLAAAEDHSSSMAAVKQSRPRRFKRKLSEETLSNNKKHDDRISSGTARNGRMPSNLNCTGFVSYKRLRALVRKTTAFEYLTQLGYPEEILIEMSYTQLLDVYAIVFLMMWSYGGVPGIDNNLDNTYFKMDPTPKQTEELLAWACPALFNWLAAQPAASRTAFHQPAQEKLQHHDVKLVAVKEHPAKKAKTSAEVLSPTSRQKQPGAGIQTATQKSTFKSVDLRKDLEASRISKHRLAFVNDFVRARIAELQWHKGDEEHLRKKLEKALASEGVPPMSQDGLLQTVRHIISRCRSARDGALGAGKHKGVGKNSRKA